MRDGRDCFCYTLLEESEWKLPRASASRLESPYVEVYLDQSATLPALQNSNHFFVVVAPNFPAVDAVVITPDRILLLQVTVAARHKVSRLGLKRVHQLVERNSLLEGRQWHFVFVTPAVETARDLCSSAAAADLKNYTQRSLALDLRLGYMAFPAFLLSNMVCQLSLCRTWLTASILRS